jgi:hypothetical protein
MRKVLSSVEMDGIVVIGEGEKDEAPMLFCGEHIGTGNGLKVDIAVDPLDGTSLVAHGRNGAVSVRSPSYPPEQSIEACRHHVPVSWYHLCCMSRLRRTSLVCSAQRAVFSLQCPS